MQGLEEEKTSKRSVLPVGSRSGSGRGNPQLGSPPVSREQSFLKSLHVAL